MNSLFESVDNLFNSNKDVLFNPQALDESKISRAKALREGINKRKQQALKEDEPKVEDFISDKKVVNEIEIEDDPVEEFSRELFKDDLDNLCKYTDSIIKSCIDKIHGTEYADSDFHAVAYMLGDFVNWIIDTTGGALYGVKTDELPLPLDQVFSGDEMDESKVAKSSKLGKDLVEASIDQEDLDSIISMYRNRIEDNPRDEKANNFLKKYDPDYKERTLFALEDPLYFPEPNNEDEARLYAAGENIAYCGNFDSETHVTSTSSSKLSIDFDIYDSIKDRKKLLADWVKEAKDIAEKYSVDISYGAYDFELDSEDDLPILSVDITLGSGKVLEESENVKTHLGSKMIRESALVNRTHSGNKISKNKSLKESSNNILRRADKSASKKSL